MNLFNWLGQGRVMLISKRIGSGQNILVNGLSWVKVRLTQLVHHIQIILRIQLFLYTLNACEIVIKAKFAINLIYNL